MENIVSYLEQLKKHDKDSIFKFTSTRYGYTVYVSVKGLVYLSESYFSDPIRAIQDSFEKIQKKTGIVLE